jgi:hypothetical protein
MDLIIAAAVIQLQRRINSCKLMSETNNMRDMGWTNSRNEAYGLKEMYKAIYKLERIKQRFNR